MGNEAITVKALAVDPIPRTIQQIVRKGVSLCDDWQDLIKYLSFYFKTKRDSGEKSKKGSSGWMGPDGWGDKNKKGGNTWTKKDAGGDKTK